MNDSLSVEQTKELKALCRAGRLYEIEKRASQWGTLTPHPEVRRTPLDVAMETGFHSLIELFICHTTDTTVKNHALEQAVRRSRFDVVQMLVDHGADPLSVTFEDVLCSYQPDMARYFMARNADLITGNPFTTAFRHKVRPALGVYLDSLRQFPARKDALQQQLDMALAYHCAEGSMKWVSLLMWAGGNPLSNVPDIEYPKYMGDPEMWHTGAEVAASRGHLDVIKKISVDARNKLWQRALYRASSSGHSQIAGFILDAGVSPNDMSNGGSSALDAAIRHVGWGASLSRIFPGRDTAGEGISTIKVLVEHGARWQPETPSDVSTARRFLYAVSKYYIVEVISLLAKHKACDNDLFLRFISTPKMTECLGGKEEIEKLLRRANKRNTNRK
ncbi:MAG: hypothetical protein PHW60_12755 [Kiritimatiellae bacterium]|nr:hypothetical protein [Kiritimatiellia bacterium]